MSEHALSSRPNFRLRTVMLVAMVALLAGCANNRNLKPVTFEDQPITGETIPLRDATMQRDHWELITVTAPRGSVEHGPTYVTILDLDRDTPHETGDYPTIDSVVTFPENDGETAWEAVVGYPHAGWLFLKMPISILQGQHPWGTIEGTPVDYQRIPPPADVLGFSTRSDTSDVKTKN